MVVKLWHPRSIQPSKAGGRRFIDNFLAKNPKQPRTEGNLEGRSFCGTLSIFLFRSFMLFTARYHVLNNALNMLFADKPTRGRQQNWDRVWQWRTHTSNQTDVFVNEIVRKPTQIQCSQLVVGEVCAQRRSWVFRVSSATRQQTTGNAGAKKKKKKNRERKGSLEHHQS